MQLSAPNVGMVMETEFDDGDDDAEAGDALKSPGLAIAPDRGRIIIVNFEMAGSGIPPEMRKSGRPCLVVQNNKMRRGRLVTVVPLSGKEPTSSEPFHHKMDHRSFQTMPNVYGGQGKPRWAKCDYISTVSLDRCLDPYSRPAFSPRKYVKVKAIKADMDAVENCILWALGINPKKEDPKP